MSSFTCLTVYFDLHARKQHVYVCFYPLPSYMKRCLLLHRALNSYIPFLNSVTHNALFLLSVSKYDNPCE